jgi:hypothetical protein
VLAKLHLHFGRNPGFWETRTGPCRKTGRTRRAFQHKKQKESILQQLIASKKKECKRCRCCSTGATFLCFLNNLKTSITETNKEAIEMWSLSLLTKRQNFWTSSQGDDATELKRHDKQSHKTQHETWKTT